MSVVICTNRAGEGLGRCLEALDAQSVRERLEVIVVDDGAPARLDDVCAGHGARLLRHPANLGLATARNTGWRQARAPIVAFTDDDCRPAPTWAESLLAAFEGPEVLAVGAVVVPSGTTGFLSRYYDIRQPLAPLEIEIAQGPSIWRRLGLYLRHSLSGPRKAGRRPVASIPGAAMSLRREALEAVGGFDPGIRFGGEDEDLFFRLRQSWGERARFVLEPDALIEHDFHGSLADTWHRAVSYGRGNARNHLKHDGWGPTVFPVPLATAGLLVLGARRPWALLAGMMVPMVAFPFWAREAWRRRSAGTLALAYVQLLEEAGSDVGFAQGYRAFWGQFRS